MGLDQPHQSKMFRDSTNIDARVTDLQNVVTALTAGDFDLVAVGRAILADADWVKKLRADRIGEINPFVRASLDAYE